MSNKDDSGLKSKAQRRRYRSDESDGAEILDSSDDIVEAGDEGELIPDGGVEAAREDVQRAMAGDRGVGPADLTRFQLDLLATIARLDAPHGLGIKARLEEYYYPDGEDEIHHGRLYPNLDDLVDHGLVEKGEIDRRTNSYTLTAEGHAALIETRQWYAPRAAEHRTLPEFDGSATGSVELRDASAASPESGGERP